MTTARSRVCFSAHLPMIRSLQIVESSTVLSMSNRTASQLTLIRDGLHAGECKSASSSLFSRRAKTLRTNFHKIGSMSVIGSPPGKQRRPVWQYDLAAMRLMWHCRRLCPEPGDLFHIPAHNLEPQATLGRSFDHVLDVPHPFGKVHLFAKG